MMEALIIFALINTLNAQPPIPRQNVMFGTVPPYTSMMYAEPIPDGNTTQNIIACRNKDIKLDLPTRIFDNENTVKWVSPVGANFSAFAPFNTFLVAITVHNVTEDSEGTYQCIRERAGGTITDEINLSVTECPRKIQLARISGNDILTGELYFNGQDSFGHLHGQEAHSGDLRVNLLFRSQEALGSSVELRCSVEGPVKYLYWFDGLNRVPHQTNANGSISVRIDPVGPRTCGYYTCVAVMEGCFLDEYNNFCTLEASVELYLREYDMEQWNDYESEFFEVNKVY